jgi:hypothetical protein
MNKELFIKYAEVKNKIKQLTDEAKKIEEGVTAEMIKAEVDQVKSEVGTFSFTTRKTWKYSPVVEELKIQLKVTQEKEETDGIATFEEKKSLTFRTK